jgi:hypothetical protein
MNVAFNANSRNYKLVAGNVLVKQPNGTFDIFPDVATFLSIYQLG